MVVGCPRLGTVVPFDSSSCTLSIFRCYGVICYSAGAIYRLHDLAYKGDITIVLRNAGGYWSAGSHSCSILLYRGFSDGRLLIVGLLLLCPYLCRYVRRPLDCDFLSRASGVCKLVAWHSCSILRRPCCSTSSYRVVHDCAQPLSAFLAD